MHIARRLSSRQGTYTLETEINHHAARRGAALAGPTPSASPPRLRRAALPVAAQLTYCALCALASSTLAVQVIWQLIMHGHCSFRAKTKTQNFCRNEYNVTGAAWPAGVARVEV